MAVYKYRDSDFRPYIFQTDNYGQNWSLLTDGGNGIPSHCFVRVVREDPRRRGLLYAGTEFGMFISFNNGKSWQKFQLNLPVTPITDMCFHENDLVISTQGRAFWIMDEISLISQLSADTASKKMFLFQPENPYRTQVRGNLSTLTVRVFLDKTVKKIKMDILNSGEEVIRSFDKLKSKQGLNRFSWNLTHEAPKKIRNAVISMSYTGGARAVPGPYRIRFTADDQVMYRDFEILKDPRWTTINRDDLQAQYDLQVLIGKAFTQSHDLIKKIRAIRDQVKDISNRSKEAGFSKEVKTQGDGLAKLLSALEADLIQTKNESGQDAINYQVKLDNQFAYLYSVVSSQDARPVTAIQDNFKGLKRQLEQLQARFDKIATDQLATFEQLLESNRIPRIIYKK